MLTAIMISVVNGTASGWSLAWMVFAQIAFGAGEVVECYGRRCHHDPLMLGSL